MKKLLAVLSASLLLAACDESSDGDGMDNTGIMSLGADFVRAFNRDANAEPLDPTDLTLNMQRRWEPFDPT